jgi:lipoprotein-anchoring transpeptidase ErfK/SrfK
MPLVLLLSLYLIAQPPAHRKPAAKAAPIPSAERINNAALTPLIAENSTGPAVIRAQILLARANFSVGEIDGSAGLNFRHAVKGFQTAHGIPPTGRINKATWEALNADSEPAVVSYTVTKADTAGPFEKIPNDLMDQAKLAALDYESVDEKLGERFHSSPSLLHKLNPRKPFDEPGTEINVPAIKTPAPLRAASLTVSKSENTIAALDRAGKILAQYPCTSGSEHDPLPLGDWKVKDIANNPPFYYNPDLFWNADETQSKARIAPGPRNPVGVVWIGITKEHYGLHGTPAPSLVGHAQSHGCVRLTNWDALQLSKIVAAGTPVHFIE